MRMMEIKDISLLTPKGIGVTFEDPVTKKRDVALFSERVSEQELSSLKVWEPSPDDVTITINLDRWLEEALEKWAAERQLEIEQILRALIFYCVINNTHSL